MTLVSGITHRKLAHEPTQPGKESGGSRCGAIIRLLDMKKQRDRLPDYFTVHLSCSTGH